jgi:hypothetical protein
VKIDLDKVAAEQSVEIAKRFVAAANLSGTEADFRREAAQILAGAGSVAGLT